MVSDEEDLQPRKTTRVFASCEFQRECWKTVRAPIARKHKIFLPYICSYQTEGDLEKCGWRDTFTERKKGELIVNEPV